MLFIFAVIFPVISAAVVLWVIVATIQYVRQVLRATSSTN